jgi:hypothetical protein
MKPTPQQVEQDFPRKTKRRSPSISLYSVTIQGFLFQCKITINGGTKQQVRQAVQDMELCPMRCILPPKRIKVIYAPHALHLAKVQA